MRIEQGSRRRTEINLVRLFWALIILGMMILTTLAVIFLDRPPILSVAFSSSPQPTRTPFLPLPVTPTPSPEEVPTELVFPTVQPPFFDWLRLEDGQSKIRIEVTSPVESIYQGNKIKVSFTPGADCPYGNQRACSSLHREGNILLFTVHSGLGGEGNGLRHALEGTGFGSAGRTLIEIQSNLDALHGSDVEITQDDRSVSGLRLFSVVRVPAGLVDVYFNRPVLAALEMMAVENPSLREVLDQNIPLVILETCGWRNYEEPDAPGVTETTGSIYLLVMGED